MLIDEADWHEAVPRDRADRVGMGYRTVADLAQELGKPRLAVWGWVEEGYLDVIKVGKRTYIHKTVYNKAVLDHFFGGETEPDY